MELKNKKFFPVFVLFCYRLLMLHVEEAALNPTNPYLLNPSFALDYINTSKTIYGLQNYSCLTGRGIYISAYCLWLVQWIYWINWIDASSPITYNQNIILQVLICLIPRFFSSISSLLLYNQTSSQKNEKKSGLLFQ